MPEYECEIPVIGTCLVTVEAEDHEAAIEAAVDEADERLEKEGIAALETYEAMRVISAGNFWLADTNATATATDADGETVQARFS